jgi:hypothetical protein
MLTKEEYIAKKQRQLDVWCAEMNVLEANAHKVKEVALLKYQEKLIALRVKRDEGLKRIEAIKAVTDGTWEKLKAGTETLWDALKDSVHEFNSHFKTPDKSAAAAK